MKDNIITYNEINIETKFTQHPAGFPYLVKQIKVSGSVRSEGELKAWWDHLFAIASSDGDRPSQDAWDAARMFYNKAIGNLPFNGTIDHQGSKLYAYDTRGEIHPNAWFIKHKMGNFSKFYKNV